MGQLFKLVCKFPLKNEVEIIIGGKIVYIKLNKPILSLTEEELRYEIIKHLYAVEDSTSS